MKKTIVTNKLRNIAIIFISALMTSFPLEILLIPANVIIGGASGVAIVLDMFVSDGKWYLSAGMWVLLINIPIIIYCFIRYQKKFALKTLLYVAFVVAQMLTFRVTGLAQIVGTYLGGTDGANRVIYTLAGGAIQGLSLPLMLSIDGSTGGSDIVGMILRRYTKRSATDGLRAILYFNIGVVAIASICQYIVFDDATKAFNTFIYSISAIFISEIVQEFVFKGFSAAYELEITTDIPEEMAAKLREELKHGTTMIKVVGGFSHTEKTMVVCVVEKRQLMTAKRIIRQVDEKAFAYVEPVSEVMGKGFINKED